jgi:hypothetical protein
MTRIESYIKTQEKLKEIQIKIGRFTRLLENNVIEETTELLRETTELLDQIKGNVFEIKLQIWQNWNPEDLGENVNCSICGNNHTTIACDKKNEIPTFKNILKFQIQNTALVSGCDICRSPFHLTEGCSIPDVENAQCENCHEFGHKVNFCKHPCPLCKKSGHSVHQCVSGYLFGCENCCEFGHTERECPYFGILCNHCSRHHPSEKCPFNPETSAQTWEYLEDIVEKRINFKEKLQAEPNTDQRILSSSKVVNPTDFNQLVRNFQIKRYCNICNQITTTGPNCSNCGENYNELDPGEIEEKFQQALTRPQKNHLIERAEQNIAFHKEIGSNREFRDHLRTYNSPFWIRYKSLNKRELKDILESEGSPNITPAVHKTVQTVYTLLTTLIESCTKVRKCTKKSCIEAAEIKDYCPLCKFESLKQVKFRKILLSIRIPIEYLPPSTISNRQLLNLLYPTCPKGHMITESETLEHHL